MNIITSESIVLFEKYKFISDEYKNDVFQVPT